MPEHTKLSVEFLSVSHGIHQVVDAEILMVFRDDLDILIIKNNEVFNIVDQPFFIEQAVDKISDGAVGNRLAFSQLLTVGRLVFILDFQPLKEMVIACAERAEPCFQTV